MYDVIVVGARVAGAPTALLLARLGDGGWDPAVQAGRRSGHFDDELVEAAAELLHH